MWPEPFSGPSSENFILSWWPCPQATAHHIPAPALGSALFQAQQRACSSLYTQAQALKRSEELTARFCWDLSDLNTTLACPC